MDINKSKNISDFFFMVLNNNDTITQWDIIQSTFPKGYIINVVN